MDTQHDQLTMMIQMLRMLQREAEARIDDLQAHLKVIRYKIEFYQSIIDERELVGSPVGVTNSESHS